MTIDKVAVIVGGIGLIAFIVWYFLMRPEEEAETKKEGNAQVVEILVERGYSPETVVVKKNIPLKLKFKRKEADTCSERILIPDFKINEFLTPNATTEVSFVPDKTGEFEFRCGMGMLHGKLIVSAKGGFVLGEKN